MKKAFIVIVAILGCVIAAQAKDRVLPGKQIPAQITSFVKKHFQGDKISVVTEDKDILCSEAFVSFHEFVRIPFFCFEEWKNILESHL